MAVIRRTVAARQDYAAIWDYVAEHNTPAADRLLHAFDQKLALLSEFPGAGQARPEVEADVRSFPVGQYLLFYRPITGGIELLRVLHGKRDVRRIFRDQGQG
jgi:toxin ParE1/3/4